MTDQARLWRDVAVSGGTVIMRREIGAAGSPLSAPGWRWEYFHA